VQRDAELARQRDEVVVTQPPVLCLQGVEALNDARRPVPHRGAEDSALDRSRGRRYGFVATASAARKKIWKQIALVLTGLPATKLKELVLSAATTPDGRDARATGVLARVLPPRSLARVRRLPREALDNATASMTPTNGSITPTLPPSNTQVLCNGGKIDLQPYRDWWGYWPDLRRSCTLCRADPRGLRRGDAHPCICNASTAPSALA